MTKTSILGKSVMIPLGLTLTVFQGCGDSVSTEALKKVQDEQVQVQERVNTQLEAFGKEFGEMGSMVRTETAALREELKSAVDKQTRLIVINAELSQKLAGALERLQPQTEAITKSVGDMKATSDTVVQRLKEVTELYKNTKYVILDGGGEKLEMTQFPVGTQLAVRLDASVSLDLIGSDWGFDGMRADDILFTFNGTMTINGKEYQYKDKLTCLCTAREDKGGRVKFDLKSVTFVDSTGMARTQSDISGYTITAANDIGFPVPGYTPGKKIFGFIIPAGAECKIILTKALPIVVSGR